MKGKRTVRIILIAIVAAALLAGGTFGAVKLFNSRSGEVNVYPVADFSTGADWLSGAETEGLVSADRIQSVYVSSTQQITEIYVEEGQTVHIGDPILSFDTTLSELALERQAIRVEQLKLDIQNAEAELKRIGSLPIGSNTPYTPTYPAAPAYQSAPYMPYDRAPSAVGTYSDPLIWLWNDECLLDEAFFLRIAALTAMNREAARQEEAPEEPLEPEAPIEPTEPEGSEEPQQPEEPEEPIEPETPAEPEDTESELDDPRIYIVFEARTNDAPQGDIERVWEMVLSMDVETGQWAAGMITPSYDPGDGGDDDYGYDSYDIDTTVYYTAEEIAQMKAECSQKIKDLQLDLKSAQLEYDRLSYELSSGEVCSRIDGVVKTVREPDEALSENRPVVLISGGGGYYVTAALGELDLGSMQAGDTVSVMSWETYQEFEGVITEISEYPDESGMLWFYSEGNQNVSVYPFKVFIDEDAELREGSYVSVTYNTAGDSGGGLYLEMPFIRQESGKSYVYTVGGDGLLEKRYIQTGKNLWGSYIEILGGLTEADYVAFPYGRQTQDGARVRYADPSELWSSIYY